jgi:flagellar basal-body rod protein FlgF
MDLLTATAAAGLRARTETLELLANNLANISTPGFKEDREAYGIFTSGEQASEQPVIQSQRTDFSQGQLIATGNDSDLALSGKGFFQVQSAGEMLLTRNGRIQVSRDGRLTTPDGGEFQFIGEKRIKLDPALPVEVDKDGMVHQAGAPSAQLRVVDLPAGAQPARKDGVYFRLDAADATAVRPSEAQVAQGRIEASNCSTSESSIKLIAVLRQFEMLQRAVQIGGEMGRKAVEEVARVNP